MYSQGVWAAPRRGTYGRRASGTEKKRVQKEQMRLVQLMVCLLLFLAVFVGKGVFPQHVQEVGGRLLVLIGQNTDFRGAFMELGQSLSEKDSVLGEIGAFCVEVFGVSPAEALPEPERLDPPEEGETQTEQEQRFLNSGPTQAALAAHYFHLEQIPEQWAVLPEAPAPTPSEPDPEPEPEPVLEVGAVVQAVDYQGRELPASYTLDRLSLGGLETVTPLLGPLWSEYGYREHPIDGEYSFHGGVDIGGNYGDAILAFASGTVEYTGQNAAYGNYLQIDHGQGIKSFYAHCSAVGVWQGQQVSAGDAVAQVGSTGNATGPHLHLELKCGGLHIDPAYYIQYKLP
ncbi:MAG: M23 family metallopeptidase [Lawsonibacter sp.]|nr:M23 family metallopeptidase [Lawsonibacter sp.]